MIDNEDVISDSSTEEQTEQQPDSSSSPAEETSSAAAPAPKSEDNVPFHMHPRFQEVISEKNAIKEQNAAFQRELQELKNQVKAATPAERDELMERLEGIDPKFAALLKGMRDELKTTKQALEEFSSWKQQSSAQTQAQQIKGMKDSFYSENKVPAERRDLYEAMVSNAAASNPNLTVNDLPSVMKQVHEQLGKMFQSNERATTKQFVEGKKAEANKPSTLKPGAPAKNVKQDSAPLSRAELLAEMKKAASDSLRADKDI